MRNSGEGSIALVTGASAGLGREFCRQLAASGHDLVLVARDERRLTEFAAELEGEFHGRYEVLSADLATDTGVTLIAERLRRGDVMLLVNNAGFGTTGSLARSAIALQETMLRLHVLAPNALTHAVLPSMIARGSGAVINVSSVASFTTSPGNVNYCASKAYLRVFSEALAQEVSNRGIVVQALCPGFTHTEFHARAAVDKKRIPDLLWLDAERVIRESLTALSRGKPVVVVPGKRYRLIVFLLRYLPAWLRARATRRYRRDRTAEQPSA